MEVVHRISFNPKRHTDANRRLQDVGVVLQHVGSEAGPMLVWFEIDEADLKWAEVKEIVTAFNLPLLTDKRFSEAEIRSSEWVVARSDYIWGYPMPDLDMGYKSVSFDPSSECPVCGTGRNQTASLYLKGEPPWRGRAFMGINWILGICARPDVIDCMREQGLSGFEAVPILKHKSGEPLHTVAQLRFPKVLPHGLIDDNVEMETPSCGHVKYLGAPRGLYRFSADAFSGCPDFAQTAEWFGSGHLAIKRTLASSGFVDLYMNNSWKGLRLEPIKLVPSESSSGASMREAGEK